MYHDARVDPCHVLRNVLRSTSRRVGVEQQVPVRELNQHTSAVLDRVQKGVAVTITRDGRPVARLVPITERLGPGLDALVATGRAVAPTAFGPLPVPRPAENPDVDVAALLVRDRERERW